MYTSGINTMFGILDSYNQYHKIRTLGGLIMKKVSIRQAIKDAIESHDSPFITVPQLCKVLPANTNIHSIRCALSKSKLVGKSIRQSGTYVRRYEILGDVDGSTIIQDKKTVIETTVEPDINYNVIETTVEPTVEPDINYNVIGKAVIRTIDLLKQDNRTANEQIEKYTNIAREQKSEIRDLNRKVNVLKSEIETLRETLRAQDTSATFKLSEIIRIKD